MVGTICGDNVLHAVEAVEGLSIQSARRPS
jgi:hypothetical protein